MKYAKKISGVKVPAGGGGSAPVWGVITGTIEDQTDLVNYVAAHSGAGSYIDNVWNSGGTPTTAQANSRIHTSQNIQTDSAFIGVSAQGLRIGFNDGTNAPGIKSNIAITNGGYGGIGYPQSWPNFTGEENFFLVATNNPGAIGVANISGNRNTFFKASVPYTTISGSDNICFGNTSYVTSGNGNTGIGRYALNNISTGSNNIHITIGYGFGNGSFPANLSNSIFIGDPVKLNNYPAVSGDIIFATTYPYSTQFWFGGKSDAGDIYFNIPTPAGYNNTTGFTQYWRAGIGTGTANPGVIIFQHSIPIGSGTAIHTAFENTFYLYRKFAKLDGKLEVIETAKIGGINIDTSAQFEISSTTKGFLPPRMTTTQVNAIASPAEGLLAYDLTAHAYTYHNGTAWTAFGGAAGWGLTGNAGTNPATNFIGTTDAVEFDIRTKNLVRTKIAANGSQTFILQGEGNTAFFKVVNAANFELMSIPEYGGMDVYGGVYVTSGGNNISLTTDGINLNYSGGDSYFSAVGQGTAKQYLQKFYASYGNLVFRVTNNIDGNSGKVIIGIGAGRPSAAFEVYDTTRGAIPAPTMTTTQLNAIASPAEGLQAFDNVTHEPKYFNGTAWTTYGGGAGWGKNGDAILSTDFFGSTNAQDVVFKSNNAERLRIKSGGDVYMKSNGLTWGTNYFQNSIIFYDGGSVSNRAGIGVSLNTGGTCVFSRASSLMLGVNTDAATMIPSTSALHIRDTVIDCYVPLNTVNVGNIISFGGVGFQSGIAVSQANSMVSVFATAGNALGFSIGTDGVNVTRANAKMFIETDGSLNINTATPNTSAILKLGGTTRGFLPPVMTTTQLNAIVSPVEGLQAFDSTLHIPKYHNGTAWQTYGGGVDTAADYTWSGKHIYNKNRTATADNEVFVGLDANAYFDSNGFNNTEFYSLSSRNLRLTGWQSVALWLPSGNAVRVNAASNGVMYIDASKDLTGDINIRATNIGLGATNPISVYAGITTGADINAGSTQGKGYKLTGSMVINRSLDGTILRINDNSDFTKVGINAQIFKVNDIDTSPNYFTYRDCALWEVESNTRGQIAPRLTKTAWDAIPSKVEGLEAWDKTNHAQLWYDGTQTIGFRYNGTKFQGFDGTTWNDLN